MKTAVLTGASSGIGQAIGQKLSQNGWRVIRLHHANETTNDSYAVDLSDLAATAEFGKRLVNELPQLDAFIHVAGIWHTKDEVLAGRDFTSFTAEQITTTMNVGLTSVMLLCNALLTIMQHGTILGVSGTFADGGAGWLPYYTSKRALEDFLVGLSQDQPQIKIFGISPADTATPAYAKFYPQYLSEARSSEVIADLALDLLTGNTEYKSGDIVEVRNGETRRGFHA